MSWTTTAPDRKKVVNRNLQSRYRNITAVVGLTLLLTITGCSDSPQSEAVSEETLRAASTLTDFPPEIEIAESISIHDCIRRAGIDMPFDSRAGSSPSLTFGLSNIFTTADEAKRLGYTSTISDGGEVIQEWEDNLTGTEREKYYLALLGPDGGEKAEVQLGNGTVISTSREGCIAEAQTEIYGSVDAALSFLALVNEYLSAAGEGASDRDARLKALIPDFEECMKQQGYKVDGLGVQDTAEQMFGGYRAPGDPPGQAEQQLALADFECQQDIGLRDAVAESFAHTASDWLRANEGKLLAMQEELKLVKDRAIEIINK
ncbi:hypothetical protein J2Y69_000365 [Microbacterium resistens]|uniref:Uncharacterized protein n=1 Tax=Microbacterium resistens TaxID=156977 RepID=A0ABU1S843_9MICO|nr:hypothetical protein [Microbacterium resistens]MDR6865783.1 hypothetical protein [Microbacterium resistens]